MENFDKAARLLTSSMEKKVKFGAFVDVHSNIEIPHNISLFAKNLAVRVKIWQPI